MRNLFFLVILHGAVFARAVFRSCGGIAGRGTLRGRSSSSSEVDDSQSVGSDDMLALAHDSQSSGSPAKKPCRRDQITPEMPAMVKRPGTPDAVKSFFAGSQGSPNAASHQQLPNRRIDMSSAEPTATPATPWPFVPAPPATTDLTKKISHDEGMAGCSREAIVSAPPAAATDRSFAVTRTPQPKREITGATELLRPKTDRDDTRTKHEIPRTPCTLEAKEHTVQRPDSGKHLRDCASELASSFRTIGDVDPELDDITRNLSGIGFFVSSDEGRADCGFANFVASSSNGID